MNEADGPSEELMDLAFMGLDHGVDSVFGGGPLIPFTTTESDHGVLFAQRSRPKSMFQKFQTIGNATYLGPEEALPKPT